MQGAEAPKIGLVTDSDLHRHILQTLLHKQGYQLALSLGAESLTRFLDTQPAVSLDAWLVDLVNVDTYHVVDKLLEISELPLLVNDDIPVIQEKAAHDLWQRRLVNKLEVIVLHNETNHQAAESITQGTLPAADTVWVLAASLGGPDAVKRFLTTLPPGLTLAMVYAQHIEVNFDEVLATAVGARHSYSMRVVRSEQRLLPGEVAVVPADRQLRFLPFGQVVATRKPWVGLYQPAIDQVIADLARVYRQRMGVIIFSGLCNDGEIGCRVAKACGATIWAQAPESCQSPEMAEAAISTGCVSFQGTPEQLAMALAERYGVRGLSSKKY